MGLAGADGMSAADGMSEADGMAMSVVEEESGTYHLCAMLEGHTQDVRCKQTYIVLRG